MSRASQHWGALAAALAVEAGVVVEQGGLEFYNSTNFGLLALMLHAWGTSYADPVANWHRPEYWQQMWKSHVRKTLPLKNRIKIAAIPPDKEQDPSWQAAVRGGLIHEVLHSKYTQRGEPDFARIASAWAPLPRREWAAKRLPAKVAWLKGVWNVFEDVFIERKGAERWLGASQPLSQVQRWVMDREEASWGDPASFFASASRRKDALLLMLRDHGKAEAHHDPSLFDPERAIKRYGAESHQKWMTSTAPLFLGPALRAEDSYHTLELAIDFAIHADEPPPPPEEEPEDEALPPPPEAEAEDEEAKPEGEPAPGDSSSSEEEGSEGEQQDDEEDEGRGPAPQPQNGEDGGGRPSDSEAETVEQEAEDEGQPKEDDGEDEGEEEPLFHNPMEVLQQEALEAYKQDLADREPLERGKWHRPPRRDQWPRPWCPTPEGRVTRLTAPPTPTSTQRQLLAGAEQEARRRMGASRGRLLALLRGEEKALTKHHQKRGRDLSNRSAYEVVSKQAGTPRPWCRKEARPRRSSAITMLLDMSGSMTEVYQEMITMLLGMAEVWQSVGTPFEVVGYTSLMDPATPSGPSAENILFDHCDLVEFLSSRGGTKRSPPRLKTVGYKTAPSAPPPSRMP
jgi:hypothetical protein